MTAVEPAHIPVLVGTNPVTYIWQPICKCSGYQFNGAPYCPLHGYPTKCYPQPLSGKKEKGGENGRIRQDIP